MYPISWKDEFEGIVARGGDIVDVLERAATLLNDRPVSALLFALHDIFHINPTQMNAIHGWQGFGGGVTNDDMRRLVPLVGAG